VTYREQKPSAESMGMSEFSARLKASLHRGEYIGIKFRDNKYHFNSKDKSLEKHLRGMPEDDAYRLSKTVNDGVKTGKALGASKAIDKKLNDIVNRQLNRGKNHDRGISM